MTEFVQTMKDWRRMCQYMYKEYGNSGCDKCRLGGCGAVHEMCGKENFLNMERDIVAWAAEHPEPVYPTWYEWLKDNGLTFHDAESSWIGFTERIHHPIPADIAEKLGIKSKEG